MTVVDTDYEPNPNPELANPERGIYYWPGASASYHTLIAEWLYLGSVALSLGGRRRTVSSARARR